MRSYSSRPSFFESAHAHQTQDTTKHTTTTNSLVSNVLLYLLSWLLTLSQRTGERGISKGQQRYACSVHVPQLTGAISSLISFYAKRTLDLPTAPFNIAFSTASCRW